MSAPTRVSAIEGDPGYREDAHRFQVRFNGVLLPEKDAAVRRLPMTADAETGELVYIRLEMSGGKAKAETEGDIASPEGRRVVHRTERGRVEILPRGDAG